MGLVVTEEQTYEVTGISDAGNLVTSLGNQLVGKTSHASVMFLGREFFIVVTSLKSLGEQGFEIEGRITVEFIGEVEEPLPQATGFRGTLRFLTDDEKDCGTPPAEWGAPKVVTGTITVFRLTS